MAPKSAAAHGVEAQRQLDEFLSRYTPEIRALAGATLAKMRERLPGATQIVYDNYNALVVGFGPSERASEAVFSIALYPKRVRLFFLNGAELPDPKTLLEGEGTTVRSIVVEDAADLDKAPVRALMKAALKARPIDAKGQGRLVIRSISKKQRPRR
ncbi:MAG TPA: DUF1801 domain-containing protein [Thermoanaerobaculia bacterium]|nr:DUF1801 domain-containing protein [Thermoanaerobaculia bacterium]